MEQQGKKTLAWVQNDLFCNCGYNLFAQPVQHDDRLGIPVSRCPECGQFHAMTTTFASLSNWRARQEQLIILTVTLSVLIFLGLSILGLWGMQMGYMELDREYTFYIQRHTYIYQSPNGMGYNNPNPTGQVQMYWFMHFYRFLCALAGFIFVNIVMTFFWHWKKRLYYVLLAIPLLAAGFSVWFVIIDNQNAAYQYRYDETSIIFGALFEISGMVIAIWLGRRTVRGLIRVFVPTSGARPSNTSGWSTTCKCPRMCI